MLPEIGHFSLVLALAMALLQGTLPLIGAHRGDAVLQRVGISAARTQGLLVLFAFCCLSYAFVVKDFSVQYVATNSNLALPLQYRLSAVWGAHEGSLLLWALILCGWTVAVSYAGRGLPPRFLARVLAVLGLVSVGFLAFMLFTSNPFTRTLPPPLDGRDLNPLLQDPGLIIHPPLLYFGYVGTAVPFAFAVAALLEGRLDMSWARWTRPWTTMAWTFLTAGITLGSWWAYYELGWGGWWFWDPVENASFMPWLMATALIHSLAVTEQRDAFKGWTVLLAILAFSLSLLGTFLVRSGVLVSVHAFATDPTRGLFILIYLAVVVGGSLSLFAWRASQLVSGGRFAAVSRETVLLANNVLLAAAAITVLLGTLFPLFTEVFNAGKISVGPPYFNAVFVPLTLPLLLIVGIGPLIRWKRDGLREIAARLAKPAVVALSLTVLALWLSRDMLDAGTFAALVLAVWATVATVAGVVLRLRNTGLAGLARLPRHFIGMTLAHLGLAAFVVGVALVSVASESLDVSMQPGDSRELAGYRFTFEGTDRKGMDVAAGRNFMAVSGRILVTDAKQNLVTTLTPEKRFYPRQGQPMTEAAIDAGLTRDLYVSLGEIVDGDAWTLRVQVKPFVRWIWGGALLMALGGMVAASDKRYRLAPRAESERAVAAPPARPRPA